MEAYARHKPKVKKESCPDRVSVQRFQLTDHFLARFIGNGRGGNLIGSLTIRLSPPMQCCDINNVFPEI